jgi:glutathione S-transferase
VNEKIGGVPTVHYFDFFSKGRGQVIRLLFLDVGIAYNDVRYSFDEFSKDIKPGFMNKG